MIKKPQFPIQQIVYRLAEKHSVKSTSCMKVNGYPIVKNEHNTGPPIAAYHSYRQYKSLQTEKFTIS